MTVPFKHAHVSAGTSAPGLLTTLLGNLNLVGGSNNINNPAARESSTSALTSAMASADAQPCTNNLASGSLTGATLTAGVTCLTGAPHNCT